MEPEKQVHAVGHFQSGINNNDLITVIVFNDGSTKVVHISMGIGNPTIRTYEA